MSLAFENKEFGFSGVYLPERKDQDPRKWDSGKLKYSLILPEFLEEMAKVLTMGEVNHPPEADGSPSWQLVEE